MTNSRLPCMILCGGSSRRFTTGHKALAPLGDKTVLAHVIDRISPQVGDICLNALDTPEYARYGLPLRPDAPGPGKGPLAGVLIAMDWARELGHAQVLTCSNDTPFIPLDWAQCLQKVEKNKIVVPKSGGDAHVVCALWPVELRDDLSAYLASGARSVHGFIRSQDIEYIEFNSDNNVDPFFNINTSEDLQSAQSMQQSLNRQ